MAKTKTSKQKKSVQPAWKKSKMKVFAPLAAVVIAAGSFGIYKVASSDAASACGKGYKMTDSLRARDFNNGGKIGPAKVNILVNKKTNKVCVVLRAQRPANTVSKPMYIKAYLDDASTKQKRISGTVSDSGNYKLYAGPLVLPYSKKYEGTSISVNIDGSMKYNGKNYGVSGGLGILVE